MKLLRAKSNHTNVRVMLALVLAVFSVAVVAYASGFYLQPAEISATNPAPVIRVTAVAKSDVYDTIKAADTGEDMKFHVEVRGQCDESYHLAGVDVQIKNETQKQIAHLDYNADRRSIGADSGAQWSPRLATIPFLMPKSPASPIDACNLEVARRIAQGDSRTEILNEGFEMTTPHAYKAWLRVKCLRKKWGFYEHKDFGGDALFPVTIRCMPTGYKAPRTPTPPPEPPHRTPQAPAPRMPTPAPPLTSVSVVASPAETKGRPCPLYVNFRGRIVANPNSTYETLNTKFRFVGDHDYKSEWLFVAVNRSEPKTVSGRRYIEAPAIPAGGTILAPGVNPRIPIYRGWMAFEVQLPNGSKRSERVDFTVDCNVAPVRPRIKA